MIISRTPFRISFFGGGTDFPEYYEEHGGTVLLTAINQYCYISIHQLSLFFKHRFRASYAQTETVLNPEKFRHPLIRECLLYLGIQEGMEISHVSDLPGQTGLGTSSAFTVGLLNGLHSFKGDRITAEDLAREAINVERTRVGDAGGHQDQYSAAYGGLIRLDFSAGQNVTMTTLPLPASYLQLLEDRLMLFYIGGEQSAENILQEQIKCTRQHIPHLQEMQRLATEAEAILKKKGELDDFGRLLHRTWNLKKELARGISNSKIDQAYEAACRAGALGGKLLGAGGRGFLLLFAPPETQASIQTALDAYQRVTFSIAAEGSRIIFKSSQNAPYPIGQTGSSSPPFVSRYARD